MFFYLLKLIVNPWSVLLTIHKKYGDIIHTRFFNKPILFVSNPEYLQEIFTLEGKGSVNRDSLYEAKLTMFGNGLFNSKGDLWVNQRKLMQPVFAKQAIGVWQDIILEEAELTTSRIKRYGHQEVNFSREMKITVQRILVRLMFSGSNTDKPDEQLMHCVDVILKGLFPHFVTATLGKSGLKHLFFIRNRRMQRAVNYFKSYVERQINHSIAHPDSHDLLSMMMASKDKQGDAMTNNLLNDETVTLFLAGQDTTVNTLIWLFYLLAKNTDKHEKVTQEIDRLSDLPLTAENMEHYTYTMAALNESMRLYPQAIALSRDTVEDVTIGGKDIAKGTTLVMTICETHRDNEYWEKPNEFYPEHFLSNTVRHKFSFIPFGAGIHSCIGRHLAEFEMMLIIITFLRVMSVKTEQDVTPAISITLKPSRDVMLKRTFRNTVPA